MKKGGIGGFPAVIWQLFCGGFCIFRRIIDKWLFEAICFAVHITLKSTEREAEKNESFLCLSTVIATVRLRCATPWQVGPFGPQILCQYCGITRSQPLLQRSVFAALCRDKWVLSDLENTPIELAEKSQPLLQRWVLSDWWAKATWSESTVSTVIATVGPFGPQTSTPLGDWSWSQPLLQRWVLSDPSLVIRRQKFPRLNRYCNGGSFRTTSSLPSLRYCCLNRYCNGPSSLRYAVTSGSFRTVLFETSPERYCVSTVIATVRLRCATPWQVGPFGLWRYLCRKSWGVSTVIATVGPFGLKHYDRNARNDESQPLLQRWVLSDYNGYFTLKDVSTSQPLLQRSVFAALRRDKWVLSDDLTPMDFYGSMSQPLLQRWVLSDGFVSSPMRNGGCLNRYCNGGSFRT